MWRRSRTAASHPKIPPSLSFPRKRESIFPNPSITTGATGRGARPWLLRHIRSHPEGATRRGEARLAPTSLLPTRALSTD